MQSFRVKLLPERVREVFRERLTTVRLLKIVRERDGKDPDFRMAYHCAQQILIERQQEMS